MLSDLNFFSVIKEKNLTYTEIYCFFVREKELFAMTAMACLFVTAQLLAIAITPTFKEAGMQAFAEPEKISNVILYIGIILIITLLILIITKYGFKKLTQAIILFAVFTTIIYVFYPLLWKIIPYGIEFGGMIVDIPFVLSICGASALTYVLYKFPEWYIIDATGIIIASGAASIFGISFGILPAMILLVALAIYDAIAVYKTKHMIDIADSVVDLRLPVLLVMPRKAEYSFLKQKKLKEQIEKDEEREAFFMGLGDIVVPGILTVSAFRFLNSIIIAYCTLFGSLIGFIILMRFVLKGKPHAGLPLLNTGALLGYLISYYIVFRNFTFGIIPR